MECLNRGGKGYVIISTGWVSNRFETKASPALTAVENLGKPKIINYFKENCLILGRRRQRRRLLKPSESGLRSQEKARLHFGNIGGQMSSHQNDS